MLGRKKAFLAFPERNFFIDETKSYLKKLINAYLSSESNDVLWHENKNLIIKKGIPLFSKKYLLQAMRYFDDPKIIIIDRDPRDVFIELIRSKRERYMPFSSNLVDKAKGFISYYRALRVDQNEIKNMNNVLFIKFEDLCLKYDQIIQLLYQFLELTKNSHIYKFSKFKPKISSNNIALYNNIQFKDSPAIKLIANELENYLYNA